MKIKEKKFTISWILSLTLILTICLVGFSLKGTRAIGTIAAGVYEIPTSGWKLNTFPEVEEGLAGGKKFPLMFMEVAAGESTLYTSITIFNDPNIQAEICPNVVYYLEFYEEEKGAKQILAIKNDGTVDPNCAPHNKTVDYIVVANPYAVTDEFYIWFTNNFKLMACGYDRENEVYLWDEAKKFEDSPSKYEIVEDYKIESRCLKNNEREIIFDADGVIETKICTLNNSGICTIDLPTKPSKPGHFFLGWATETTKCMTSSMILYDKTTLTISKNTNYIACFVEENKNINIDFGSYKVSGNYVYVDVNTTKEKFEENIEIDETGVETTYSDNLGTKIKTGLGFKISLADGRENSYVIVVLGDLTENGTIDTEDYAKIYSYFQESYEFKDLEEMAADYNEDGTITTEDYAKIYSYWKEEE